MKYWSFFKPFCLFLPYNASLKRGEQMWEVLRPEVGHAIHEEEKKTSQF